MAVNSYLICAALGLIVASWKDNALAVYLPLRTQLLEAINSVNNGAEDYSNRNWQVRVEDPTLRENLSRAALTLAVNESNDYIFIDCETILLT